jgi:acyl carrier protein
MTSPRAEEQLRKIGVRPLPPAGTMHVLDDLLAGRPASPVIVADMDWTVFKPLFSAKGAGGLFDRLETPEAEVSRPAPSPQWQREPLPRRRASLARLVQQEIGAVLEFPEGQLPDVRQGFFEMGLDSMASVSLRERLQKALGIALAATVAFDYPNVEALAAHLAGLLEPAPVAPPAPAPLAAPRPATLADWDHLPVDEFISRLETEIELLEKQA